MLRLAQVGKVRASDAASDIEKLPLDELISLQLIRKEYLVLCRKDSHTICAIKDPSEIETEPGSSFSCTVCGRLFKEEYIQDIYALSDNGKKLLSGSRWMTIWITDLLVEAGLVRESIAWNPASSEDELDIMTDALLTVCLFRIE